VVKTNKYNNIITHHKEREMEPENIENMFEEEVSLN
jgi:hypothetical protein